MRADNFEAESLSTHWNPADRPAADICPKQFCFHWLLPGGMAETSGRRFKSVRDAAKSGFWLSYPDGGCACTYGVCTRLDAESGISDCYEPNEKELAKNGLPWFYFCNLACLRSDLHERFL